MGNAYQCDMCGEVYSGAYEPSKTDLGKHILRCAPEKTTVVCVCIYNLNTYPNGDYKVADMAKIMPKEICKKCTVSLLKKTINTMEKELQE
jgi:hypothetical protein